MSGKLKRLGIIGVVVLLVGGFFGYRSLAASGQYISTDDAYIDGRQVIIAAPASGKLVDWTGTVGSTYPSGSTVGDIQTQAGNATSTVAIPIPQNATIVERSAVNDEFVAAGTPLAYAYNLHQLWVTANIKETVVRDVHVGAPVTIQVDAYPQLTLKGTVSVIEPATADTFSLIPTRSNTGNFTKVTAVIPVRIRIDYSPLAGLVPGMNVTVQIAKKV